VQKKTLPHLHRELCLCPVRECVWQILHPGMQERSAVTDWIQQWLIVWTFTCY
jgi:hypothetical protein